MQWLRVRVIARDTNTPPAPTLINLDRVMGFIQPPDDHPLQIWFSQNPIEPAFEVLESMEEIEAQLGLAIPQSGTMLRSWQPGSSTLGPLNGGGDA